MKAPTPSQLRHDIDRGRTGDKVSAADPAAVPLGTDEEAAGTPVPPAAVAHAREHELYQGRMARERPVERPLLPPYVWSGTGLVVLAVLAAAIVSWLV
jgi:hypothetical protein